MSVQYKVEYTHTHEHRKHKVKRFRHGWCDYDSTRTFLQYAKYNPRISDVKVYRRTVVELDTLDGFDLQ